MRQKILRTTIQTVLPLLLATLPSSCGIRSPDDSDLNAAVGTKPVTIPSLIQAESFNAALDLSAGNIGTECDARNNPDVDIKGADDVGGGCFVGWTQTGEALDYYILNRSSEARVFDIELRLASADRASKVSVESPVNVKVGEVSAIANGYAPGLQNWVTRSIKDVSIAPGLQIVRIKFQGESNLNWLNVKGEAAPADEIIIAEEAIKRSCAGCHDYLRDGADVNWTEVARRAASFKARLGDKVSPMPPNGVPQLLQISSAERTAISSYVSAIADSPLGGSKPIASRSFTSRGMQLQRDTMAEGAGHIWGMSFLPDGNILATLKSGEIKIFNPETRMFQLVTGGPKAAQRGQGGLLDVGISPDFGDDQLVYFSYAKDLGNGEFTTALSRARLDGAALKGLQEIFVATGANGTGEHFGGRIVVDTDGSIWLSIGERNDRRFAQRLDVHLGKVLRLTADGKAHPENPFVSGGGLPEIFSYGHRNPQGLAKNVFTGEIWESEHGPKGGDEINRIQKGVNFGWPLATFGTEYSGDYLAPNSYPGTEQPMHWYVPSIAPSGMSIYASDLMPNWKGLVISGALAMTHLNFAEIKDGKKISEERLFGEDRLRIREVEQAPTGELWYAADTGQLFRIRPRN